MAEGDAADALEGAIEQAKASGDMAKANELYQRQIGNIDPFGLDSLPAPAASDAEGDDPPETSTGDLVVATNAEDETATISGGMDFVGNPEHVAQALEAMSVWDHDETGQPDGDSVEQLKAEWGSDMAANLTYFQSFALAHPDVHELLVASGFGDHPALIMAGAILGRRYMTKAGDAGQVTTRKAGAQTMDSMATTNIRAQLNDLQERIERAQARHDTTTANRLYAEQLALQRRLPGGADPAIGEGGRTA